MIKQGWKIFLIITFVSSCEDSDQGEISDQLVGASKTNYYLNDNGLHQNEFLLENPFYQTKVHKLSTFSVNADGASYFRLKRTLSDGSVLSFEELGTEEMINMFVFNYGEPENENYLALNHELSECPWQQGHHLLQIGIKGKTIEKDMLPPANFVFLIDVSGSMSMDGKLELLKKTFGLLVDNLRPVDRLAVITYSEDAGELISSDHVLNKEKIIGMVNNLGASGITAGAKGLKRAYDIAAENYITGGNNRVFIATDGDFNVGPSTRSEFVNIIKNERKSGIYLTILAIGNNNINDAFLHYTASMGNGEYEHIDCYEQAVKVFKNGYNKLFTVASDVKIEVEFNDAAIQSFRLVGYENTKILNTGFENDDDMVGNIGAGQTITALYELVLKDKNEEFISAVKLKYKNPEGKKAPLINTYIPLNITPFSQASENMKFASAITAFSLQSRDSGFQGNGDLQNILNEIDYKIIYDPFGYKSEFLMLIKNYSGY